MTINENKRLSFSGHETFQCRNLWLKKGYDFVKRGKNFNDEDSVVELGVGKNMVSSIRYWMKAFDLLDSEDKLTILANKLFDDNGWDPYLEDSASIWLLHYHLVFKGYASIYSLIFNEFRKEKIEFTRASFLAFAKRKAGMIGVNINDNTVNTDFETFLKLYNISGGKNTESDDSYTGILFELGLIQRFYRENGEYFFIENDSKSDIPHSLILYGILNNSEDFLSISFNEICQSFNSVGNIFAINRTGIIDKIEEIIDKSIYGRNMVFSDQAGIRELQFHERPNPISVLEEYYLQTDAK